MAGALEVTIREGQRFFLHRLLFVGVDFWWGAPLVSAFLIAIPALLLAGPLSRAGARFGLRIRYGLPLGLACFGLLLLFPWLARWAAALLAGGVATQGGLWLANRSTGFERLVRKTLPALLLLPALGGTGLHLSRVGHDAPLSRDRQSADGPNILLLVLDTVRAMELGLYGFTPSTSPNLDALARQGVTFDQAFSSAPWTAPSHGSLFTGRQVNELSIDWTAPLDGSFPTLAEQLSTAGYATVGIVANTEYLSAETGLARGFAHYEDYRFTGEEALRWTALSKAVVGFWKRFRHSAPGDLPGRIGAEDISRRFLRWLDHRAPGNSERPFFAFLNYFDAHGPYFPPEPFWSRVLPGERRRPLAVSPGGWSIPSAMLGRQAYQGAIGYLDRQIGALLDSLRARGALRETLVIVAGDHGEEFFEHGLMGHGNSLYAPSVRVPLLLVWPGHLRSSRVREPVGLAAIPATIMDLLDRSGPFPGPSLVGYWSGRPPAPVAVTSGVTYARNLPAWYPVSRGALASARVGRYRYIWTLTDSVGQLYDHETDPMETRNLAGEPWAATILRALRDTVANLLPQKGRRIP